MKFNTKQENFWATDFGNDYIHRNNGEDLLSMNVAIFSKILKNCKSVKTITEFGCNIGLNLIALNRINKNFKLLGYEINEKATIEARSQNIAEIVNSTITEPLDKSKKADLTFTKLVLIHINPDKLSNVYQNLYDMSNKYILVYEYFNPIPVTIDYRGNSDVLFKRDFAGELIDKYNLKLIDYGFNYNREMYLPKDDATWFLLEK
jgi:pseudaminic acid biosynthesis-associated methylase